MGSPCWTRGSVIAMFSHPVLISLQVHETILGSTQQNILEVYGLIKLIFLIYVYQTHDFYDYYSLSSVSRLSCYIKTYVMRMGQVRPLYC